MPQKTVPDKSEVRARLAAVHRLVGRTPLIAVRCRCRGRERTIFAKHEIANFTGSIKDRMALHILEDAHARGGLFDTRPRRVISHRTGQRGDTAGKGGGQLGRDAADRCGQVTLDFGIGATGVVACRNS